MFANIMWQFLTISKQIEQLFSLIDLFTIMPMIVSINEEILYLKKSLLPYFIWVYIPFIYYIKRKRTLILGNYNLLMQFIGLLVVLKSISLTYPFIQNKNQYKKCLFGFSLYIFCFLYKIIGTKFSIPFLRENTSDNIFFNNVLTIYDVGHFFAFYGYLNANKIRTF